jgi:hypothetical protein
MRRASCPSAAHARGRDTSGGPHDLPPAGATDQLPDRRPRLLPVRDGVVPGAQAMSEVRGQREPDGAPHTLYDSPPGAYAKWPVTASGETFTAWVFKCPGCGGLGTLSYARARARCMRSTRTRTERSRSSRSPATPIRSCTTAAGMATSITTRGGQHDRDRHRTEAHHHPSQAPPPPRRARPEEAHGQAGQGPRRRRGQGQRGQGQVRRGEGRARQGPRPLPPLACPAAKRYASAATSSSAPSTPTRPSRSRTTRARASRSRPQMRKHVHEQSGESWTVKPVK